MHAFICLWLSLQALVSMPSKEDNESHLMTFNNSINHISYLAQTQLGLKCHL